MPVPAPLRRLFGTDTQTPMRVIVEREPIAQALAGMSARKLFATQDNLHAVVTFLAESVAQLPLKLYIRESDTKRERSTDSKAALLLARPNADQTMYEFVYASMIEFLLYGECIWWLLPDDSPSGYQLRVLPKAWVQKREGATAFSADVLHVRAKSGNVVQVKRDDFISFRMYSPEDPAGALTPIQSLKSTMAEQVEAERFRREIWRSSGRFNAYISRPKDVQPWEPEQRKRFVDAFRESWGADGENAGKMPLLEDGMSIQTYQFSAHEMEYVESIKLTRETVAAAYHVNPSLIWHSDTQTYASARDAARALYSETLGPTVRMFEQRVTAFLLPRLGEPETMYAEFDMQEKLRGSFEEQASVLQSAVGAPYMLVDEARARMNLSPLPDGQGDSLVVPMNVTVGGLASPNDTDPTIERYNSAKSQAVSIKGRADEEDREKLAGIVQAFVERQSRSVLPKMKSAEWWDADRWDEELADDLTSEVMRQADAHGIAASRKLSSHYDVKRTGKYLRKMCEGRARLLNEATYRELLDAEASGTPASEVFEKRAKAGRTWGMTLATAAAGWAVMEACRQSIDQAPPGQPRQMTKTWVHVPSQNPRPEHEAMDGETVPFEAPFSNGAQWPGDGEVLDVADIANCNCEVEVTVR